jgi:hypothetical protein
VGTNVNAIPLGQANIANHAFIPARIRPVRTMVLAVNLEIFIAVPALPNGREVTVN